jgi:alkanesulfonate monooxygenase SsuD/methylene tetrahydromethanopterin reductase-like flavin-dependent oxidoreductase (luciferase family)
MTSTEFAVALPQVVGDDFSSADIRAFATRAEGLGFSALWVSELTSAPILDPLAVLAYAAAATTVPRLGVAVLLTPLRIPVQLARDLASVDRLSDGRLVVGVGFGSSTHLYPAYGVAPEHRLTRYVDGLELVQRLWIEDGVTFRNEWWQLDDVRGLAPVQTPHPPIWFGARRGSALRRAAEIGDGWIGSGSAPYEEFCTSIAEVHRRLDDLGRDPEPFTIAKRVYIEVDDDVSRGRARMREWFAANYGKPHLADEVAVVGDADRCAEHLHDLRELGVDHFILNPVIDPRHQLDVLAVEVLPRLR